MKCFLFTCSTVTDRYLIYNTYSEKNRTTCERHAKNCLLLYCRIISCKRGMLAESILRHTANDFDNLHPVSYSQRGTFL